MRAVLRRWFGGAARDSHLRRLLKKFRPRHEKFQKRRVLSELAKNAQIGRAVNV